jgi:hypothetical protein
MTKAKTQEPQPSDSQEEAREPVVVSPDRMELAEQRQADWRGVLPGGTRASDIHARPEAFALCAHMLSIGDSLTLITADEKFMFRCVCVVGDRLATITNPVVYVLDTIKLPRGDELSDALPSNIYVRRAVPGDNREGWLCCWKREDGEIVLNGEPIFDKAEAEARLRNHAAVRSQGTQTALKAKAARSGS